MHKYLKSYITSNIIMPHGPWQHSLILISKLRTFVYLNCVQVFLCVSLRKSLIKVYLKRKIFWAYGILKSYILLIAN